MLSITNKPLIESIVKLNVLSLSVLAPFFEQNVLKLGVFCTQLLLFAPKGIH
jgi:hypothetical protein